MKKRKLIIIGTIIILSQFIFLRNYLFPFFSNKIVVKGIRCTCPDAEVKSGVSYLKSITPDSLIKYNLDYTEIFFENEISTISDPMGVQQYIISGKIIGKSSISEGDGHNYPLFKIDEYEEAFFHNILKWIIHVLILIELFVFFVMVKRKRIYA